MCFLARAAPSGESLRGEGLVRLIGAVVCSLAACRGSNCTLTRDMDGRNLHCITIGSCQSTATSYDCTARLNAAVSSAIEESDLLKLVFGLNFGLKLCLKPNCCHFTVAYKLGIKLNFGLKPSLNLKV